MAPVHGARGGGPEIAGPGAAALVVGDPGEHDRERAGEPHRPPGPDHGPCPRASLRRPGRLNDGHRAGRLHPLRRALRPPRRPALGAAHGRPQADPAAARRARARPERRQHGGRRARGAETDPLGARRPLPGPRRRRSSSGRCAADVGAVAGGPAGGDRRGGGAAPAGEHGAVLPGVPGDAAEHGHRDAAAVHRRGGVPEHGVRGRRAALHGVAARRPEPVAAGQGVLDAGLGRRRQLRLLPCVRHHVPVQQCRRLRREG
jgi:hypothetical protein